MPKVVLPSPEHNLSCGAGVEASVFDTQYDVQCVLYWA